MSRYLKKLKETNKKSTGLEDIGVKIKMVKTLDGKTLPEAECIFVGSCRYWFPKGDERITRDYFNTSEEYSWIEKRRSTMFFCELDETGNDINSSSMKYTHNTNTKKLYTLYSSKKGDHIYFSDASILFEAGFVECLESGIFWPKKLATKAKTTKTGRYREFKATKKFIEGDHLHNQRFGLASSTYTISEGKRYSLGFELETSVGYLPPYVESYLNCDSVKDGSLRDGNGDIFGGEYVTGVLVGDMGFKQLKTLCNELNKRCQIDKRCGRMNATL